MNYDKVKKMLKVYIFRYGGLEWDMIMARPTFARGDTCAIKVTPFRCPINLLIAILQFRQIYFAIWTNTFDNLNKYILQQYWQCQQLQGGNACAIKVTPCRINLLALDKR